MTLDQSLIAAVLLATVGLFLWGRFRHDIVSAMCLLMCVVLGLVPSEEAFTGFGHPAVITVACVPILSRALQNSGAVDLFVRLVLPKESGVIVSLFVLVGTGAFLSGFMNNVGAMALLMPVAIPLAKRLEIAPGKVLMPLSFGTILGGMTTLIGTPPNLIVSGFREDTLSSGFGMFDFAPVGLGVMVLGLFFIILIGWRLVPYRKESNLDSFETGSYTTEARVLEGGEGESLTLRQLERKLDELDVQVVGLIRNDVRLNAPHGGRKIFADDILILETEVETLPDAMSALGLELVGALNSPDVEENQQLQDNKKGKDDREDKNKSFEELRLMEFVVRAESQMIYRSARSVGLRSRWGLNLLAVSREGSAIKSRIKALKFQAGDLLLVQGPEESLSDFANESGCVPLAEREIRIPSKRKAAVSIFILAFAIIGAVFGLLPAAISFAIGVVFSMIFKTISIRSVYDAIDWPVIILLAALIPVAEAMETTGLAGLIAGGLINHIAGGNVVIGLVLILVVTMFLSDLMNNAATAAVMCPIAIGVAKIFEVNSDAFLMSVAIGASCAFLTPIGHQNNTLILGPGGFRFGDYWKMGIILEVIVVAVSIPLLLYFWPL